VTIAPGIMETPMLLGMPAEVQESLGQDGAIPIAHGQAGGICRLVRHIAENAYLNGEVIRLDGAIRMGAK
jgi:NAD(P)-dependent dehydrogenase (short-subunit alcohol dehydrogenase family)